MLVERAQYAVELVAATDDEAGRGDDAVDALAARETGIFLDAVDRHFGGAAEDRKHRAVLQKVDGVITPLAGGDFAAVEAENAVEFATIESHSGRGGGGDVCAAPGNLAWVNFAEGHTAPPLTVTRHNRVMIAPTVSDGKRPANTKTIMTDIPIGVDN